MEEILTTLPKSVKLAQTKTSFVTRKEFDSETLDEEGGCVLSTPNLTMFPAYIAMRLFLVEKSVVDKTLYVRLPFLKQPVPSPTMIFENKLGFTPNLVDKQMGSTYI